MLFLWTSYEYESSGSCICVKEYYQRNWCLYICLKVPFDKQSQGDGNLFFQLHKTVIRDNLWKEVSHILADLFLIEMLQTTIAWIMKEYQNQHDFCLGHGGITVILTLCGRWKSLFCHHCIKKLAKIICHTKYFYNFVFGDHSDYCLCLFVFQHYKDTTFFANHQFYRLL